MILAFCLIGCTDEIKRTYDYCVVDAVKHSDHFGWEAHCNGGGTVMFSSEVKVGDEVYYSPFWVDNDSVTTYGYIKSLHEHNPK